MSNTDKKISQTDTSAATRNAGKSPYLTLPERESYSVFETYERADGTRYIKEWDCYRWGGQTSSSVVGITEVKV